MLKLITFLLFFILGLGVVMFYFKSQNLTAVINSKKDSNTSIKTNFSIKNSPSQSIKGNLDILSKGVLWESRIATEASQINKNITIQQGESVDTTSSGSATLTFPKSCQINILKSTALDILQTLPLNLVFGLRKGSAIYTKTGVYPLSIQAMSLLVQINNGKVFISVNQKTNIIFVEDLSGSTTIAYDDNNLSTHVVNLQKNQTFTFNNTLKSSVY